MILPSTSEWTTIFLAGQVRSALHFFRRRDHAEENMEAMGQGSKPRPHDGQLRPDSSKLLALLVDTHLGLSMPSPHGAPQYGERRLFADFAIAAPADRTFESLIEAAVFFFIQNPVHMGLETMPALSAHGLYLVPMVIFHVALPFSKVSTCDAR